MHGPARACQWTDRWHVAFSFTNFGFAVSFAFQMLCGKVTRTILRIPSHTLWRTWNDLFAREDDEYIWSTLAEQEPSHLCLTRAQREKCFSEAGCCQVQERGSRPTTLLCERMASPLISPFLIRAAGFLEERNSVVPSSPADAWPAQGGRHISIHPVSNETFGDETLHLPCGHRLHPSRRKWWPTCPNSSR